VAADQERIRRTDSWSYLWEKPGSVTGAPVGGCPGSGQDKRDSGREWWAGAPETAALIPFPSHRSTCRARRRARNGFETFGCRSGGAPRWLLSRRAIRQEHLDLLAWITCCGSQDPQRVNVSIAAGVRPYIPFIQKWRGFGGACVACVIALRRRACMITLGGADDVAYFSMTRSRCSLQNSKRNFCVFSY